jgi:hypothetical protein
MPEGAVPKSVHSPVEPDADWGTSEREISVDAQSTHQVVHPAGG